MREARLISHLPARYDSWEADMASDMRILLLTREYPPDIYGGAGVHVEYLARELAKLAAVEVRTFGRHDVTAGSLVVRGHGNAGESADDPEGNQAYAPV